MPVEFVTGKDWEEWEEWCEETAPLTDEVLERMADYFASKAIKLGE
jgi:hypothetical protein